MTITDIEIIKTENKARQLADVKIVIDDCKARQLADVKIVIDDCLLIQNVKLIDNGERIFVAFSYTERKGEKVADVIPLTHKVRGYIEDEVIKKYRELTERNECL